MLTNPYKDSQHVARLSADIDIEARNYLCGCVPIRGVLQNTINTLLAGVIADMKQNGINHYTPDNFNLFCDIVARHSAVRTAVSERTEIDTNVGGPASPVCERTSESSVERTSTKGQAVKRRKENKKDQWRSDQRTRFAEQLDETRTIDTKQTWA